MLSPVFLFYLIFDTLVLLHELPEFDVIQGITRPLLKI